MTLDTQKMHRDILKRLNEINKPQRYLYEKLGVARSTFYRLSIGKDITTTTMFIILQWLDRPISRYIKYKNKREKRIY